MKNEVKENKEPLSYLSSDPLYVLDKPKLSPYMDFVKLYFNLSKAFNIIVIVFSILALALGIFFNILTFSVFCIVIYILVAVVIGLFVYTNFYLPHRQMKQIMQMQNREIVEFYKDCLLVKFHKGEKEEIVSFDLRELKKKKQTKKSYLIYQGKIGILLSKDNDYPQEVREILDNLFVKAKR